MLSNLSASSSKGGLRQPLRASIKNKRLSFSKSMSSSELFKLSRTSKKPWRAKLLATKWSLAPKMMSKRKKGTFPFYSSKVIGVLLNKIWTITTSTTDKCHHLGRPDNPIALGDIPLHHSKGPILSSSASIQLCSHTSRTTTQHLCLWT